MTNTTKSPRGRPTPRRSGVQWERPRSCWPAAATYVLLDCTDAIPDTPTGMQQAIPGLFSFTGRPFQDGIEISAYAREAANFTNTEPRFIRYDLGFEPIPIGAWIEIGATSTRTSGRPRRSWRPSQTPPRLTHAAADRRAQRSREDDRGLQLSTDGLGARHGRVRNHDVAHRPPL